MDITRVRLIGLDTIDLPIVGAQATDAYILKAADGLGPPEVDVSITNTPNQGGVYQGRRPQLREVVLRIGLTPNYFEEISVGDLRNKIYGLLTPGYVDSIRVEFLNEGAVLAQTHGYVKRIEVPFGRETEVQVVVSCLSAYLDAPSPVFLGSLSKSSPQVMNHGTAPTGFQMDITFTANMSSWAIHSAQTDLKMQFDYAFLNGDRLSVNTNPDLRGVSLIRGGVVTNLISSMTADSTWLMLHGGMNYFTIPSASTFNWSTFTYVPKYWGI